MYLNTLVKYFVTSKQFTIKALCLAEITFTLV